MRGIAMRGSSLRVWTLSLVMACSAPFAFAAGPPAPPVALSLDAAVRFALENNPQLAVARTQRGLAGAGIVIARIYPHNPVLEAAVLGVNGPATSGITN